MQAYSMDLCVRLMADVDAGQDQGDSRQVLGKSRLGAKAQTFSAANRQLCGSQATRVARHEARPRTTALGAAGSPSGRTPHSGSCARPLGGDFAGNQLADSAAIADHFQKKVIHDGEH